MWNMTRQALFLERDGILIEPDGYIKSPEQVRFIPGAVEALQALDPERFDIFIATDQPGIAFGKIGEKAYEKLTAWILEELRKKDVQITKVYTCPFHPKGRGKWKKESVFRKPNIGIFKMAQQEYNLNLRRCWMVCHSTRDVLAAQRAGVPDILVTDYGGGTDGEYQVEPTFKEKNLREAVRRILYQEAALLR